MSYFIYLLIYHQGHIRRRGENSGRCTCLEGSLDPSGSPPCLLPPTLLLLSQSCVVKRTAFEGVQDSLEANAFEGCAVRQVESWSRRPVATAYPSEVTWARDGKQVGGEERGPLLVGARPAPQDHSQFISFPLLKATACRSRCLPVGVRHAVLLVVGNYHGAEGSAVDFHVYQVLGARPFRKKLV